MDDSVHMRPINRFLTADDYNLVSFRCIRRRFEHIFRDVLKKRPYTFGARFPEQVVIHWSRAWEYPWAIINSGVKAGEKVLDCGCGDSPLLPLVAESGCEAYGVDPRIHQRTVTHVEYYVDQFKKMALRILNTIHPPSVKRSPFEGRFDAELRDAYDRTMGERAGQLDRSGSGTGPRPVSCILTIVKRCLRRLCRPDGLWYSPRRPQDGTFNIKYFDDSLTDMHFPDRFFDKVFCISVMEHLSEEEAFQGMKEMTRVLKKGGLLIVTMDHDGPHVTAGLRGAYAKLIQASRLKLHGPSDFAKPDIQQLPGTYHVVGFILEK